MYKKKLFIDNYRWGLILPSYIKNDTKAKVKLPRTKGAIYRSYLENTAKIFIEQFFKKAVNSKSRKENVPAPKGVSLIEKLKCRTDVRNINFN